MNNHLYPILLTLFSYCLCNTAYSQDLHPDWESMLKECEVLLPIKGSSKYDAADAKIAKKYENTELVWLHLEKSMKKDTVLSPIRVYLVSEALRNGSQVEYIIPVEDYKAGINAPIFPEWKSKKNKFYRAECFTKIYLP